jgi:cyclic pyranopterin phosphate synthase
MSKLTHLDEAGRPLMVDISAKDVTERRARAEGRVRMDAETLAAVLEGPGAKGNVLRVAELAGIMAAKRTGELIPLCHPLPLTSVKVRIDPDPDLPGLIVSAEAKVSGRTGVEMEALTAVSVACLTLYDMLKAKARGIVIEHIMLVEKEGGASGLWRREPC